MDLTLLLMLASLPILGSCCSNPFVDVGSGCFFFSSALTLDHPTAQQVCVQINGQLAKIVKPQQLWDITQYIKNDQTLYSSYWVNGAEVEGDWLYKLGQKIPLGTPFWATFSIANQEYGQQPVDLPGENCVAIRKETYYFFTSNNCDELYSPLCEEIEGTASSGTSMGGNTSSSSCGGAVTGFSGEITSPNYPNAYPDVNDCTWTIATMDDSAISFTLNDFDTYAEENHGYLEIRDGPDSHSPLLGKYWGHDGTVPTPVYLVTSNAQARISFWTDTNANGHRGFSLSWTAVWTGGCHIESYSPFGDIQSPWYPERYPSNLECAWIINADNGSIISLKTISFQTEKDKDIVQIRDGADNNGPLLIEMSGSVEPGYEVLSTNNQIFISFKSDDQNYDKGFAFKWAAKETCPAPYLTVGRMCLHFIFTDLTYGQSGISCQENSGQLAAITDSQDLRDLYIYLQNQGIGDTSFWLGGNDSLVPRGIYCYIEGMGILIRTPFWGATGDYSEEQEPTGSNAENCLLLDAEGFHYFRDAPCDTMASALCMYF
ncbi:unnamed protein product, partial [Meganyctiphanes norvegica]